MQIEESALWLKAVEWNAQLDGVLRMFGLICSTLILACTDERRDDVRYDLRGRLSYLH